MTNSITEKNLENELSDDKAKRQKKIVVGLSGGVDSSLSAALLVKDGWEVDGLTLWLMKGKGSCCSDGLIDAAAICEDLGINHHILDSRNLFSNEVLKKTIELMLLLLKKSSSFMVSILILPVNALLLFNILFFNLNQLDSVSISDMVDVDIS